MIKKRLIEKAEDFRTYVMWTLLNQSLRLKNGILKESISKGQIIVMYVLLKG